MLHLETAGATLPVWGAQLPMLLSRIKDFDTGLFEWYTVNIPHIIHASSLNRHLIVVEGFKHLNDPRSYAGRVFQGNRSDRFKGP